MQYERKSDTYSVFFVGGVMKKHMHNFAEGDGNGSELSETP